MSEPDLNAIRAAAEGVDPEDWYAATDKEFGSMSRQDASYIATMDPQTTLALLDRLDAAETRTERYRTSVAHLAARAENAEQELAAIAENRVPCRKCGVAHVQQEPRCGYSGSWADPNDGHPYDRLSPRQAARAFLASPTRGKDERHAVLAHGRSRPVVLLRRTHRSHD
jgi:hypothetical protein